MYEHTMHLQTTILYITSFDAFLTITKHTHSLVSVAF